MIARHAKMMEDLNAGWLLVSAVTKFDRSCTPVYDGGLSLGGRWRCVCGECRPPADTLCDKPDDVSATPDDPLMFQLAKILYVNAQLRGELENLVPTELVVKRRDDVKTDTTDMSNKRFKTFAPPPGWVDCWVCDGGATDCDFCDGAGKVRAVECARCNSTGCIEHRLHGELVGSGECPKCAGAGKVKQR